jgi:AdoMet-dependent heme synthase
VNDLDHPTVNLEKLDELWFQVVGTRCNLTCTHCFISCSPTNLSFGNLDLGTIKDELENSRDLGVKEYYFTGGEPFLHPDIVEILSTTLAYGPATVLTNGTVMTPALVDSLAQAAADSIYSLEVRVSIDHFEETANDKIRGAGSHKLALRGISRLVAGGFLPIITAMRTWEIEDDLYALDQMAQMLLTVGVTRPRVKLLPSLKLGAEAERTTGYETCDYVTKDMLRDFPVEQFACTHSRIITDRGVHVCPILIEAPDSVLGSSLRDAKPGFELSHQACSTCYTFGAFCINPAAIVTETGIGSTPVSFTPVNFTADALKA